MTTPEEEIDRLAAFIVDEVPGGPDTGIGVVDMVIRGWRADIGALAQARADLNDIGPLFLPDLRLALGLPEDASLDVIYAAVRARRCLIAMKTEPHIHCWHTSSLLRLSDPPVSVETCCWCGSERDKTIHLEHQ